MQRLRRFGPLGKVLIPVAALALMSCANILGFEEGLLPPDDDGGSSTGGSSNGSEDSGRGGSGIDAATSDRRPDDGSRGGTAGAGGAPDGSGGTTGGSGGATGGSGGATGGRGGATGGSGGTTGGSGGSGGATGGSGGTTGGSGGTGTADASMDGGTGGGGPADASIDRGPTCGANQKMCGSVCVSTTDPGFGCATSACTPCVFPNAAPTCAPSGQCAMGACNSGFDDCNADARDGCETDLSKAETCGSCTKKCDATAPLCSSSNGVFQCVTGCTAPASTLCGSQCVDVQNNVDHCGNCNVKCTPPSAHGSVACRAGQCATDCATGYTACGTECVDTNTNLAHCGGCNRACTKTCMSGLCCDANQTACNGACVNTASDLAHCGGCNRTCNGTCTNGTCCAVDQTYCSGVCVDTRTNPAHCGGCGMACAGTCTSSTCCATAACSPTSPCFNLMTDPLNCGSCGHNCLGGGCANGLCQPVTIAGGSSGNGMSITVDAQNVYWTDRGGSTTGGWGGNLKVCPKTGCGGPTTVLATELNGADTVVYDSGSNSLFVASSGINVLDGYAPSGSRFMRVMVALQATTVTTDSTHLYWNAGGSIVRANKDGTGPVTIADGLPTYVVGVMTVDASASQIYATCPSDTGAVVRTPTTGSATNAWSIFGPTSQKNPTSVFVDRGTVYWTTRGTFAANYDDGGVYMCPTSGCTQGTPLLAPANYGNAIIADATHIYFSANSHIYRCPISGCSGSPTQLTSFNSGSFYGSSLTQDATAIYWINTGGSVNRLAK